MSKYVEFLNEFFSRGLETYNRDEKDTPSKGIVNPGGARLWFETFWKRREKVFIKDTLFNIIKDFPVSLYTMSRVLLDKNGKPMVRPGTTDNQRQQVGLMLYSQYNDDDIQAQGNKQQIIEQIGYLKERALVGSDIIKEAPNIEYIRELQYKDSLGMWDNLKPEGCLFLLLPSGGEESSMLWGYRNKSNTRADLNEKNTTIDTELEDLGII